MFWIPCKEEHTPKQQLVLISLHVYMNNLNLPQNVRLFLSSFKASEWRLFSFCFRLFLPCEEVIRKHSIHLLSRYFDDTHWPFYTAPLKVTAPTWPNTQNYIITTQINYQHFLHLQVAYFWICIQYSALRQMYHTWAVFNPIEIKHQLLLFISSCVSHLLVFVQQNQQSLVY